MKKQLLITALFFSFISVSAQQKKYSQEAIDLNDRATEIMLRNLSNKDSIAEVLNLLDKAIALDQSYITAYGNKVNLLLSEEEYDQAIKTLDEAIKYNPEQHGFYLLKAKALEEQGQSEEALAFYKKALETCEIQMKKNPAVGSFLDSYFLKYCIYGIDTPASEVISAIPTSFTDEQRKSITVFLDAVGSFKKYKDVFIKNGSRPLNQKKPSMPQKREDGVYYVVDELAEYPGGHDAMIEFVSRNFRNPANSKPGTVLVNFVVEADGTIRDAEIMKSLGKDIDDEALRVVNMMPKWKPAKVGGRVVAMVYNIPFIVK